MKFALEYLHLLTLSWLVAAVAILAMAAFAAVRARFRGPIAPAVLVMASWASFLLAPGTALADAGTAATSSGFGQMALDFVLSHLTTGIVVAALGFVGGKVLDANRKRQVSLAVFHAFQITEDLVAECDSKSAAFPYLTKADAGLKAANDYMRAQGWRPLKPGEQDVAKLTFKSMNAQTNAAAPAEVPAANPPKAPAAA